MPKQNEPSKPIDIMRETLGSMAEIKKAHDHIMAHDDAVSQGIQQQLLQEDEVAFKKIKNYFSDALVRMRSSDMNGLVPQDNEHGEQPPEFHFKNSQLALSFCKDAVTLLQTSCRDLKVLQSCQHLLHAAAENYGDPAVWIKDVLGENGLDDDQRLMLAQRKNALQRLSQSLLQHCVHLAVSEFEALQSEQLLAKETLSDQCLQVKQDLADRNQHKKHLSTTLDALTKNKSLPDKTGMLPAWHKQYQKSTQAQKAVVSDIASIQKYLKSLGRQMAQFKEPYTESCWTLRRQTWAGRLTQAERERWDALALASKSNMRDMQQRTTEHVKDIKLMQERLEKAKILPTKERAMFEQPLKKTIKQLNEMYRQNHQAFEKVHKDLLGQGLALMRDQEKILTQAQKRLTSEKRKIQTVQKASLAEVKKCITQTERMILAVRKEETMMEDRMLQLQKAQDTVRQEKCAGVLQLMLRDGRVQQQFVQQGGRLMRLSRGVISAAHGEISPYVGPMATFAFVLKYGTEAEANQVYEALQGLDPLPSYACMVYLLKHPDVVHHVKRYERVETLLCDKMILYRSIGIDVTPKEPFPIKKQFFESVGSSQKKRFFLDALMDQCGTASMQTQYFISLPDVLVCCDHVRHLSPDRVELFLKALYARVTQLPNPEDELYEQLKGQHPRMSEDDLWLEVDKVVSKNSGVGGPYRVWQYRRAKTLLTQILSPQADHLLPEHRKLRQNLQQRLLTLDATAELFDMVFFGHLSAAVEPVWMAHHIDLHQGKHVMDAIEAMPADKQPMALQRFGNILQRWLASQSPEALVSPKTLQQLDKAHAFLSCHPATVSPYEAYIGRMETFAPNERLLVLKQLLQAGWHEKQPKIAREMLRQLLPGGRRFNDATCDACFEKLLMDHDVNMQHLLSLGFSIKATEKLLSILFMPSSKVITNPDMIKALHRQDGLVLKKKQMAHIQALKNWQSLGVLDVWLLQRSIPGYRALTHAPDLKIKPFQRATTKTFSQGISVLWYQRSQVKIWVGVSAAVLVVSMMAYVLLPMMLAGMGILLIDAMVSIAIASTLLVGLGVYRLLTMPTLKTSPVVLQQGYKPLDAQATVRMEDDHKARPMSEVAKAHDNQVDEVPVSGRARNG